MLRLRNLRHKADRGLFYALKTNILLTPTQLGGLIQRNLKVLEHEGLHITNKRNGNQRLWHCTYEEPSENNE